MTNVPLTIRIFSDFICNASYEEKKKVYDHVMEEVDKKIKATIELAESKKAK